MRHEKEIYEKEEKIKRLTNLNEELRELIDQERDASKKELSKSDIDY